MDPDNNNEEDAACLKLFSDFWRWRLEESPEFASMCGFHGSHDARLDSWALEAFERRREAAAEFLRRGRLLLQTRESLDLRLLCYDLNVYVKGMELKGYVFPVSLIEGPQVEFDYVFGEWIDKSGREGVDNLLARLEAFPRQIDEKIVCMKEGIKLGLVLHSVSLRNVVETIKGLLADADHLIDVAVKGTEVALPSADQRQSLRASVEKLVNDRILPAFEKLHDFLRDEYLPKTRADIACRSLPNGERFYKTCLEFHASYAADPMTIHSMGLKEVERIEEEVKKIAERLGFHGSLREFNYSLIKDEQFYFDDADEMLREFRSLVFDRIRPRLGRLFKDPPFEDEFPLRIEPTPDSQAAQAPIGYYLAGTGDGARPSTFFVNLYNYRSEPKYQMTALTLHEAEPGHHLQAVHSLRQKNLPDFRKMIEDRLYTIAPSRFPIHSAFTEGWGLYSESLGLELGLYSDPYSLYGKYQMELLRSARLVVDTGMHWFNWSRRRALDYLFEHTALSATNIYSEIDRYVTWPGQACAYKIGENAIRELRKKAEKKLGNNFDVKEFHERVLSTGFAPLEHLENEINKFVGEKS